MAVNVTHHVNPQPAVNVDLSLGESLRYTVGASGATPVFTLSDDRGRTILTSQGLPPSAEYIREWPISPEDEPFPSSSEHAIIGLMGLVTQYTYKVELLNSDGSVKETVIHSDFDRVEPFSDTDKMRRSLSVELLA